MDNQKSILIIGRPNSGKTTYLAKLYDSLDDTEGILSLSALPDNLSIIEQAQERLTEGLAVEHTVTADAQQLSLPILRNRQTILLDYPDYGGEQVKAIVEERQINGTWQSLVESSDYWLLFVNIDDLVKRKDITTQITKPIEKTSEALSEDFKFSQQAFFIELLQILLYSKGFGLHKIIKQPKICVALSCWDTLKDEDFETKPKDYLKKHLPLLHDFIYNIWDREACSVIGLSSQGKALDKEKPDAAYEEQGYYEFGYLIEPDGNKNKDLTWVIEHLLKS